MLLAFILCAVAIAVVFWIDRRFVLGRFGQMVLSLLALAAAGVAILILLATEYQ